MKARRTILAAAAATTVLGGGLAAAVPALATTAAFTTTTVSAEHPDTTGLPACSACLQGPGGPIWASDHLKETIKVTSAGAPHHYNVTIRFGGSTFSGFADPRANGEANSDGSTSGGPMFSQGAITGSITYDDITSASAPGAVPNPEPPDTTLAAVRHQLFGGADSAPVSTHYSINYTPSMNSVDPTGTTTGNVWTAGTVYNQTG